MAERQAVPDVPAGPPPAALPRRVALVFNPAAAEDQDAAPALAAEVRDALAAAGLRVRWLETTPDDPGQGLVRRALRAGVDLVMVCGGDGTVMACASALAGSGVPLALLPRGTGNLLATNLDLPADLDGAVRTALRGRRRRLDVGALGDDRFVVMAGMGFDAAMLRDADPGLKARVGALAYVLSGLRNLRRASARFELRLDDRPPFSRVGQGVLVGNLGRLQGGLPVLPDAAPDDGQLDVAVLRTRRLADWLRLAAGVLLRRRPGEPELESHRARRVEVRCRTPQPVQRDGEPAEPSTRMAVEVVPAALTLCVPDERNGRS
jgi:YegS/Rv2252/BmrU family lipid kinase